MRMFMLPAAASMAVFCAAVPVSPPPATAGSAAVKDIAPHYPSTEMLPAPTFLAVPLAVIGGVTPPPNSHTSVYTVSNDGIEVVRVPLSLPESVNTTVRYAADVVLTSPTAPGQVVATGAAAAEADAPEYTLLDVLGLPIQTALAIIAGGTAGVTLPTSPLIPSPYTSVYTVINDAIAVVRVPLALAFTGQFAEIGPQTQAALTTFVTSLTQGLPASIRGTLEYDASVIQGFLSGARSNTRSERGIPATSTLAPADGHAPVSEPAEEQKPKSSTDDVDRLQAAVDKELEAMPTSDDNKTDDNKTDDNKTEDNEADEDKAEHGDNTEHEEVDDKPEADEPEADKPRADKPEVHSEKAPDTAPDTAAEKNSEADAAE